MRNASIGKHIESAERFTLLSGCKLLLALAHGLQKSVLVVRDYVPTAVRVRARDPKRCEILRAI